MKAMGTVAFVLHAHLPYVHHWQDRHALEHRWLFEAITECYLPLLEVFEQLRNDNVRFRVTLSLSPTLSAMLADPWLQQLYEQHLQSLIELAQREQQRVTGDDRVTALARCYETRWLSLQNLYRRYGGDLLQAWRQLRDQGYLELITTSATHAVLPLLLTKEAVRAQVATAIHTHEAAFGEKPKGFWLPECAFSPGIDQVLREFGIVYTFVGKTALDGAIPASPFGSFSPFITPGGLAAFAGDAGLSAQVWSSKLGYPGDPAYREYYRDIGYELDLSYLVPYLHPEGIRVATGIKYYRVTGPGDDKDLYDVDGALDRAKLHAKHFASLCRERSQAAQDHIGRIPLLTLAFDAELFGHWWYEGPAWLGQVLRELDADACLEAVTPSAYLPKYADYPVCDVPLSTWGRDGYAQVWLNETNDWLYPALHQAEVQMTELCKLVSHDHPQSLRIKAMRQAMRELMLAQASDWTFMMDGKSNACYGQRRATDHVKRFRQLSDMILSNSIDETWLGDLERSDAIFPDLDLTWAVAKREADSFSNLNVLLLTWEYPPLIVGGLSRHVYDLSRHLVKNGCEVHVVTLFAGQGAANERVEGVHVHRIDVVKPDGGEFMHWVLSMNLTILAKVEELITRQGYVFDLVHAHDWLVGYAAMIIKQQFSLPLVATIHATEHGRNGGIRTAVQQQIHAIERELVDEAYRVIVCSHAMKQELSNIFSLPGDKQYVLPNGVDLSLFPSKSRQRESQNPLLVFVGRLVREKGVQTLLEALPEVVAQCPDVRLVILGDGPMMQEWKTLTQQLGLADRVTFAGFASDHERNEWLSKASVAVFPSWYEPFGIVTLEAMAMRVPVVVSDVGGLSDIVRHGENGRKAFPGHAHSLAEQIIGLLHNPDQAEHLAHYAFKELIRYDWQVIAQQTIGVYRNALGVLQLSHS